MTKIKALHLHRSDYGIDKGRLSGKIEFEGPLGAMTINLDGERAEAMLRLVADLIVETARDTAHLIAADAVPQAVLTEEK